MKKWLSNFLGKNEVKKIAEKQLEENLGVIESLRDYDKGEKDIPTADIERRLRRVQNAR